MALEKINFDGLGTYLREQRDAAEMSLRQLANASGVSNPYLSQVERGLRKPSAEILGRLAGALRISAETLYIQAGLLPDAAGEITVPEAIAADEALTERQRRSLLDIYWAFLSENNADKPAAKDEAPAKKPSPKKAAAKRAPAKKAAAKKKAPAKTES